MPAFVDVSGTWRHLIPYVNISGAWRQIPQIYINVNNTWRPLWTYSWSIGGWGTCSATCGGGTQTRTVTCIRSGDNRTFGDNVCTAFGAGTKPPTSQPCNTQSCVQVYTGVGSCRASGSAYCSGNCVNVTVGWLEPYSNCCEACMHAILDGQTICMQCSNAYRSCTANGKTYSKISTRRVSCSANYWDGESGYSGSSILYDLQVV